MDFFFKYTKYEKTVGHNSWGAVKVVLGGIAFNTFIREEDRLKINELSFPLKLVKE